MIVKLLRKLVNIIFWLVLFVFFWMVCTWVANDFDRTKMNFFGYAPNLTMSASMEPTIMTGDLIITKQIEFEDVQVGDIIVYRHDYDGNYRAIVHRVIDKNEEYIICKGDNNEVQDPWFIYPEDVRAKVILH